VSSIILFFLRTLFVRLKKVYLSLGPTLTESAESAILWDFVIELLEKWPFRWILLWEWLKNLSPSGPNLKDKA
jgi:hypothetical protein